MRAPSIITNLPQSSSQLDALEGASRTPPFPGLRAKWFVIRLYLFFYQLLQQPQNTFYPNRYTAFGLSKHHRKSVLPLAWIQIPQGKTEYVHRLLVELRPRVDFEVLYGAPIFTSHLCSKKGKVVQYSVGSSRHQIHNTNEQKTKKLSLIGAIGSGLSVSHP